MRRSIKGLVEDAGTPDFLQHDLATEQWQDDVLQEQRTGLHVYRYDLDSVGPSGNGQLQSDGLVSMITDPIPRNPQPLQSALTSGAFSNVGVRPIFRYPATALLDMLGVYNASNQGFFMIDPIRLIVESNNYTPLIIGLPGNSTDAVITWRQTFRDQINVPKDSMLIMIAANATALQSATQTSFRLQLFDDGAGEYIYDKAVTTKAVAGNEVAQAPLNNRGPFIVPSPISVAPPGLMTVYMSNVETSGVAGDATNGAISAFLALIFAVPKVC